MSKDWKKKNPERALAAERARNSTPEGKARKRAAAKKWLSIPGNLERMRASQTKHNKDNREKRNAQAREYKTKRNVFVAGLKTDPCKDCGKCFHFSAMDFDHVRGEKSFSIASNKFASDKDILAEIAKCDLVCANCHRVRTWQRAQRIK